MGLGILEDKVLDHVPGTTRYFDDPDRPQTADTLDAARGLKCDTSGSAPIVLHPQPSDDPNDPLNWPLWRRDVITLILSLTAIFATALGPILAANTLTLSLWFGLDFTRIALLTGYFLLGVGFAGFFFVPSGRIWGKRHLFILGTLITIGSSAWGGAVGKNYTSFLWSRIIQGVGTAPFESLVNAAVGDLYFVHERGKRMAFTNLAVFGGAFFTPVLVGKITHTIGWWWTFYLVSIFLAVCLVALVLFCPETAFRRDAALNTDMGTAATTSGHNGSSDDLKKQDATSNTNPSSITTNGTHVDYKKKTFVQSLALFDGRKTDDSFFRLLFRPLPLFVQPAFLWACLIQGTMIGWTVFIGVVLAAIFLGPPLFWNEVSTGYAYLGPFVGALLGFAIAGGLADWSAKYLTRRNGGVYEPEFRILLVIPQLVFGCMGLYGFAVTSQGTLTGANHWVVPIMFFGFEVCGMVIGAVASSLYIVDAYRDLAVEGFTCLIIFKNMFSFGLTFKAYEWLVYGGIEETFHVLASVQVVVCLLSIPMYIYGKRNRSFFYRHDIIAMTVDRSSDWLNKVFHRKK
ncbi:major facilitator superfamily transporter [Pseudomassariella vexata]|uniref:Major facilitator superfamily transporter n=1 Tax=Pseudomassariella vexata TaxID=1141098 RepID=A0A1Y2DC29_9PEZI|nr:major facilitator superfamily transporter [Pseudomassariella vexata]ORY56704.1 major facilitator superfamily transporter [Pseudomassariella vexata]